LTRAAQLAAAIGILLCATTGAEVRDPFDVLAALDRFAEKPLWPRFDPSEHPLAIYDGARTLLLRHPHPPEGFAPLEGHEGVHLLDGRHAVMRWNATADLDGVRIATLLLTIQPDREVDIEASILLHEVFHVFSKPRHPTWSPDAMARYGYPLDDPENYALLLLEEEALALALETDDDAEAAGWAAEALRLRRQRTGELAEEHVRYETAMEMQEGTAVYVARLALGTARDTTRLREIRAPRELRWRFYDTGAALGATLDRLDPSWKSRVESEPDVTMDTLLGEALRRRGVAPVGLPAPAVASIRARAQRSMTALKARRTELRRDFLSSKPRVVVLVPGDAEPLRPRSFDPLALEILDRGEVLHAHRLTLAGSGGEIVVENPRYERDAFRGVVALTASSGGHPFRDGLRRVTVSGFSDEPVLRREKGAVIVEAEGLRLRFDRAVVRETDGEIRVLPAAP